ncbi:MAG: FAD-containing oxidoreductase [Candidatus Hydrogenedens sp.]|nr:FAD-containing oxidoreductase [Candidatus Hydrogenedens sp.]
MADEIQIPPMDEHNRALREHVHPSAWENPAPQGRYNLVVIGAGTAGLVTAAIGAGLGAKVALIERHLMGGDCLNFGCVPSKALLHSSRMAAIIRAAGGEAEADFSVVMERVRRLRSGISRHDSAARFRDLGVDVYFGDARFADRETVEVGGKRLRFKKAVIATGARAVVPPIPGLAEAGCLTNETVFSLTERPESLLVIGGGPIGCELAQAFQRLGTQVTLVEKGARLLPREDLDASAVLLEVFRREGMRVLLNAEVSGVENGNAARVRTGGTEQIVQADAILAAAGRAPNVEGMNLEAAGVRYDTRAGVEVNDALQTSSPHIFAAGDVCSRYQFTHTADFAARIVAQNVLFPFLPKKKFSSLVVPWCTYTEPEVAHVGASEAELHASGAAFDTLVVPMDSVDRAILEDETEGFAKVLVDAKGTILGATIVGAHAGELISELTLAMSSGLKIGAIGSTIHPYPTQAEILRKAADAFNRKKLTPERKAWLAWLFARMR